MALIRGSVNVQFFFQNYISSSFLPYCLVITRSCTSGSPLIQLERNSEFHEKLTGKMLWNFIGLLKPPVLIFSLARFFWLFSTWHLNHDFEQLFYYSLLSACLVICIANQATVDRDVGEMCYLVSQRFIVAPIYIPLCASKYCFSIRKPELLEVLVYCMAGMAFTAPALLSGLPFLEDYDPIHIFIRLIWNIIGIVVDIEIHIFNIKIFNKVVCSMFYFVLAGHQCQMFFSFLLTVMVTTLEGAMVLSRQLYQTHAEIKKSGFSVFSLQKLVKFSCCVKCYRILQILTFIADDFNRSFLGILICMGAVLFSWLALILVTMYKQVPIFLYATCCLIMYSGLVMLIIIPGMAAIPHKNGGKFVLFWRGEDKLKSKLKRKILKSCPPIGFALGLVQNVNPTTALVLPDILLNCAATLILTKIAL